VLVLQALPTTSVLLLALLLALALVLLRVPVPVLSGVGSREEA
jgi:hypothetical protein